MANNIYSASFLGEKLVSSVAEPAAVLDSEKNLIKMNVAMEQIVAAHPDFNLKKYAEEFLVDGNAGMEKDFRSLGGSCYKIDVHEIHLTDNDRGYLLTSKNVTELKRLKRMNMRDRMYRTLILPDIIGVIEGNLTSNEIEYYEADWIPDNAVESLTYKEVIDITRTRVSVTHRDEFAHAMSRNNLLKAYGEGVDVLRGEYLWKSQNGYVWARVTVSMVEDAENGDINVLLCINDVDREKRESEHWIERAEKDALTGLYNRSTATGEIERFLARPGSKRLSALMMIDIDDFKNINDTFGHIFGDAVLTELGAKIRSIFRENDVLCRLGGDEFVIFMKNIDQMESAERKAEELCRALDTSFSYGDSCCHITCSIGIAFAPSDGRRFEDLYSKADVALYGAKRQGKNKWLAYSKDLDNMQLPADKQKEIRQLWQTSFSNSIDEYVFKALYNSKNLDATIPTVLEFLAKHFDFTEAFILEAGDNLALHMAYEWNENGTTPLLDDAKILAECDVKKFFSNFDDNGILYMGTEEDNSKALAQILEKTGAKSGLQFAYSYGGRYAGALGFADARKNREFTLREIEELKTTSQIISIFLLYAQTAHILRQQLKTLRVTLDSMESPVIIVGADSHRLSFINKAAQERWPDIKIGDQCYSMYNLTEPCEECPIEIGSLVEGKRAIRVERSSTEEDYCIIWLNECDDPIKAHATVKL